MWLDTLNAMKKRSGKTGEQISVESGIPKGTLNKIFAGQTTDPKYSTLSSLVHCLGYTVDDLEIPVEELELKKETSPAPAKAEAEEVEKWLTDLLVERGYIRPGEDISDRDAEFLIHWIGLLDAWFEKE
jgi:transcriptional regulator with XRE-family HTH domain